MIMDSSSRLNFCIQIYPVENVVEGVDMQKVKAFRSRNRLKIGLRIFRVVRNVEIGTINGHHSISLEGFVMGETMCELMKNRFENLRGQLVPLLTKS